MEANGVLHPRGSEYQTLFVVDGIPMDENRSPAFAPDLKRTRSGDVGAHGQHPSQYGGKSRVSGVTTNRDIRKDFMGRSTREQAVSAWLPGAHRSLTAGPARR
jgi:hypothetical protein